MAPLSNSDRGVTNEIYRSLVVEMPLVCFILGMHVTARQNINDKRTSD
jgi:hypothetical protein